MADRHDGAIPDPVSRRILGELRDLRKEMRDLRMEMREDRRRWDEQRDEDHRRWEEGRLRSDERFTRAIEDFRQDAARRDAVIIQAFREAFGDVRTVGLSIVKTLNRHTRILERIDRKLGVQGNGRSGGNGRGA
jgi:hypothetical protein